LIIHALFLAIVALFVIFPVSIGPVQLAFLPLVAVIVAAEFIGVWSGMIVGLFFGLLSLVGSYIQPSLLAQAFQNPLISVLPRILIGISAYFAAKGFGKLFPKLKPALSYAVGAAAGVITNTALVVGLILALHFGSAYTYGGTTLVVGWQWLIAIITSNFLIEFGFCIILVPPIVFALNKAEKGGKIEG
jgi:Predicted membrane protein